MRNFVNFTIMLLLLPAATGLRINEIMYNPEGPDDNEFIEIFGTNNLSNFTIGDVSGNDTLTLIQFGTSNFSLIVADSFNLNLNQTNTSVYSAGSKIGNGLGNSGDTLYLFFNNALIENITYSSQFANGNGKSLEFFNGTLFESFEVGGSPGSINLVELLLFNTNNSNKTNNSLQFCNVTLDLVLNDEKIIYDEGEKIRFKNVPSSNAFPYVVQYEILDVFENPVRNAKETSNSNTKQFTPQVDEPDRVFIIRNNLSFVNCSNIATQTSNELLVIGRSSTKSCQESVLCSDYISQVNKLEEEVASKNTVVKGVASAGGKFGGGGGGGSGGYFRKSPTIESFYTRKKKFDPLIKIFSTIKGTGIYEIVLTSHLQEFNKTIVLNKSESIELLVNASPERNLYVLELYHGGKLQDLEKLIVVFNDSKSNQEFNNSVALAASSNESKVESLEVKKEKIEAVAGSVVYDTGKKPGWLIVSTVLVASVAGFLVWKSYKEAALTKFL